LFIATMMALGISAAHADDSSMSRFGGESYAYFNSKSTVVSVDAGAAEWRRAHPNGLSEREIVALSSSDLSAAASTFNPAAFSRVAADTMWRQTHPNGFTEREMQALSSSSLASWQAPGIPGTMVDRSNIAGYAPKGSARSR
jgi:hypothetical protein